MANASEIKNYLDNELKPDKLGTKFEEINENAINLFQRLFVEYLNYDLVKGDFGEIGVDILSDNWSNAAEAEEAYLIAEKEEFRVIYILIKKLTKGRERSSINSIKRLKWAKKREYICIFYARDSVVWDLVCPHIDEEKIILRRFILGDGENHRTVSKNLSFMDASESKPLFERVQEAFKVQPVTDAFFEDYKKSFFLLKEELAKQGIPKKEAHEFTLQFLNRIMFIYFISKKEGWLNTKNFIGWLWKIYCEQGKRGSDEFYELWLRQIYFKAFNNRANEIKDLPTIVIEALNDFPFLNGGLFTSNDLDKLELVINDDFFFMIFNFFEDYNFTIREDSRFDIEVAVDPQMIGYVYESLANVAEEIYDRHDLGIFYTPRIEVDFMARRSLVEYLSNKLSNLNKEHIYLLVFGTDQKEKSKYFQDEDFWYKLEEILDDLSVVDPACGSGAFLVGMLNVLTELYKLIYKNIKIKRNITDFGLKKRIIQYCLYGVDIMPWAIHAAELRLWLQLMVETELKKGELRKYPLLPNLDLNFKIGDSLVQEIGGIFFNLRTNDIDLESKKRLQQLKQEKRYYFDNYPGAKFSTSDEIRQEEIKIFEDIIEKRIINIIQKKIEFKKEISVEKGQKQLFTDEKVYDKKKVKKLKHLVKTLGNEKKNLEEIKNLLDKPEKKPFIWDIDFAEIFGDKNGFDIVIGNPPYLRHEEIAPFNKLKAEITKDDKTEYKLKLLKSVINQFPVVKKIDGKSDYYIYFYFHGLSLLNKEGIFCFITSNSWLDVDYGKNLQEFLLKYVPIIAIYDTPKRVFEHASINTIIALFGAPVVKQSKIGGLSKGFKWTMLNSTAKFIMFKKSFEEAITNQNLIEIDKYKANIRGDTITDFIDNVIDKEEYRAFPIIQEDLLAEGWKYPTKYNENKGRFKKGSYKLNKWGGKYLRAPSIYFKILKKGKNKLIRFGDIAEIKFGIKTGANDFFYLDDQSLEKWNIEDEFIKSVIKSPKECKKLILDPNSLKFKIFMIHKPKSKLKNTNALKYINWGENVEIEIKQGTRKGEKIKGFHKIKSVQGRDLWYDLGRREFPHAIWVKSVNDNHGQSILNGDLYTDQRLYEIYFNKNYSANLQAILLNNSFFYLDKEINGRVNLGDGVLDTAVFEAKKIYIINPDLLKDKEIDIDIDLITFKSIFDELNIDPNKPIKQQTPKPIPERFALDKPVFQVLNLEKEEINELYLALIELVYQRLEKAKTFKK